VYKTHGSCTLTDTRRFLERMPGWNDAKRIRARGIRCDAIADDEGIGCGSPLAGDANGKGSVPKEIDPYALPKRLV
jgi:hypothetical protein